MCGIAGFTHRGGSPSPELIERATRALTHRGPDQQGTFETNDVSLGAVRLRIIDLEGGAQPLRSGDGGTVIAFNGEIYNHVELRAELEQRGHRFHSRSDTEVVLHAFLEWDTECFARLHGMFGLALWRESGKRLVLARDRMGIKPVYYVRRGAELHFGSELKAILEHPDVERRIDLEGLGGYLSWNWIPSPHTLVDGVQKLPPGHWLEWRDGGITTDSYWRLEGAKREWTLGEAKEELDFLLRRSVKEHLISDVPLGVWSSGGIDSSTVVHYASEQAGDRLKTFSVSFLGRSFDESRWFREVAGQYGTDHHEFDLNPEESIVDAIQQMSWNSDEPSADAGALPVWFLSKMCRRHVTVALSGEGADELFGGYYTYLADRYAKWLRRAPAFLRRAGLGAMSLWPVSDDKISFEYKLKRFLEGSLLPADQAHTFWNGTFREEEKTVLLRSGLARRAPDLMAALSEEALQAGALSRYLRLDQIYYLPDDILYKCDRMSMAHSLEVRPVFLDHRIVEFAASLPDELKVRGSNLKFVLRELMRGKLPDSVLARRKEGFDIPAHDWFRGPLRELLLDTVTEKAVERGGLFRWEAVRRVLDDHLERRRNLGYHLWGLLTLFLWMDRWKIQTPRTAAAAVSTTS